MISIGDVIQIIKIVINFFKWLRKRWTLYSLLKGIKEAEEKGELHVAYDTCKEFIRKFDKDDKLLDYVAEALVKQGELGYKLYCCHRDKNKKEREEAEECFSKVIEEFVPSGKKRCSSVVKAYLWRGVIQSEKYKEVWKDWKEKSTLFTNKESRKKLCDKWDELFRKACEENYSKVIKRFSQNHYPDVVLAVAQARLNQEIINYFDIRKNSKEACRESYKDIIKKSDSCKKHRDEFLKLATLLMYNICIDKYNFVFERFYFEDSQTSEKKKEVIKICDEAIKICLPIKAENTDDIKIDLPIWSSPRLWEGKSISFYEIIINIYVLRGKICVCENFNDKDVDDVIKQLKEIKGYKDDKQGGVRYKRVLYFINRRCCQNGRLLSTEEKETVLDKLRAEACKAIIDEFSRITSYANDEGIRHHFHPTSKYCKSFVKLYKNYIIMLDRLEKDSDLKEWLKKYFDNFEDELEDKLYNTLYQYGKISPELPQKVVVGVIQQILNFYYDLIDDLIKEFPYRNKSVTRIRILRLAVALRLYSQRGDDNKVIERCKELICALENSASDSEIFLASLKDSFAEKIVHAFCTLLYRLNLKEQRDGQEEDGYVRRTKSCVMKQINECQKDSKVSGCVILQKVFDYFVEELSCNEDEVKLIKEKRYKEFICTKIDKREKWC